ncbi:MAG TPA: hypothetical protein VLY24_08975, partial [Bryobacteraceae bacterium]|nr:hypothetical protein [Bryobacteraceae bacterium]
MRSKLLGIGAFVILLSGSVDAQDISGNWQGTVKAGPQELRVIVRIAPGNGGGWKATLSSIDQSPD